MIIDEIIKEVTEKPKVIKVNNNESGGKKHQLALPYVSDKGAHILRSMEKYVRKVFSKKSTLQKTYSEKENKF